MPESGRCPQCGTLLPPDAPRGACPKCLLGLGFDSRDDVAAQPAPTTPPTAAGRFVAPSPAALAPHFPQLEILELLGQGGMGAVYKARQRQLNRLVALKILPPQVAADPAFAERFTREAQALAQLNHSHIVAVHDSGQAGGLYYFVMEYVDGVNLRRMLAEGKLAPAEALAIVPQICEALQYAHDEGVVHRDIKPENLLLDKRGRVKIADFGLARLVGPSRPEFTLTGTQQVMGTPHYMAPEQMERPQAVDHRADIYSLGVVFYEMLTGELPLGRFQPPSKKVQLDVRLDEVVLRSLEKEPERRYQQASAVKTDVELVSRSLPRPSAWDVPADAVPPAGVESAPRASTTALVKLRVCGVLLMLLGLGGGAMGFVGLAVMTMFAVQGSPRYPTASNVSNLLGFVGIFVLGTLVATAAWCILRLRNHQAALLGCLLSFGLALMLRLNEHQNALALLGFVPGAVALYFLLQPEIRAKFGPPSAKPPCKPPAKQAPAKSDEPSWQTWWFEQTPATRKMLKVAMYAFAVMQMIFFAATEVHGRRGHTSVEVGMGGSWLTYETGRGLELDLLNWSFMSGVLAVVTSVALWRVIAAERRHAAAAGQTAGGFWSSTWPVAAILLPAVAVALIIAASLLIPLLIQA
jgi:aminoglycoside phosphotransferase (APT) family kinase protein